jgi:hypothetical protein
MTADAIRLARPATISASDEVVSLSLNAIQQGLDSFPDTDAACERCDEPTPVFQLHRGCCPMCTATNITDSVFSPAHFDSSALEAVA